MLQSAEVGSPASAMNLHKLMGTYLHQQFALDASTGFVLSLSAALRTQAVDLVNEDDAGGVAPRHLKQTAHHALALTPVARHGRSMRADSQQRTPIHIQAC